MFSPRTALHKQKPVSGPLLTQPATHFHVELSRQQPDSLSKLASLIVLMAAAVWGLTLTYSAVLMMHDLTRSPFWPGYLVVLVATVPALGCVHVICATIAAPDKRLAHRSMLPLALAHLPMSGVVWVFVQGVLFY